MFSYKFGVKYMCTGVVKRSALLILFSCVYFPKLRKETLFINVVEALTTTHRCTSKVFSHVSMTSVVTIVTHALHCSGSRCVCMSNTRIRSINVITCRMHPLLLLTKLKLYFILVYTNRT
mgnify:CR=1 FL=1